MVPDVADQIFLAGSSGSNHEYCLVTFALECRKVRSSVIGPDERIMFIDRFICSGTYAFGGLVGYLAIERAHLCACPKRTFWKTEESISDRSRDVT